jgi:putative Flp pilus-assembly TadE/G-like protein
MTRHKSSCGQAYVLTILFLVVLLGMAAAVIDIGSWYRAHRALQATVDSAALAGAQELPEDPGQASALAASYAAKNGGGSMQIAFSSQIFSNDTITVTGTKPAPGFFSKVFGVNSITVKTHASARAGYPTQVKYVAPIVVDEKHPMLQCNPNPCTDPTELVYQHFKKNGSPDGAGNFGFINLTGDNGVGASDLGNWIESGFDQYMGLGNYDAETGNEFSSTNVGGSLEDRIGTVLLFPIYRKLSGNGTNAQYQIVGWAGFRLTGLDLKGSNEKLLGHFESVTWDGIQAESAGSAPPNFGVKNVSLVD